MDFWVEYGIIIVAVGLAFIVGVGRFVYQKVKK